MVTAVAGLMLDGGPAIVSGGEDNTVRVWDAAGGAERACLRGHENRVTAVAGLMLDGRRAIVSGGWDNTVRVWDAASGEVLKLLRGFEAGVTAMAAGAVGGRSVLVTGEEYGTIRLRNLKTGRIIARRELDFGVSNIDLRDGVIAVSGTDGFHLTQLSLDAATLTPRRIRHLVLGQDAVLDCLPLPDGNEALISASANAWRFWRAQGLVDGNLVTSQIDHLPRATAAQMALATAG